MHKISELLKPPDEAYRYWPDPASALIETPDSVERLIFRKQKFQSWEQTVLSSLLKLLKSRDSALEFSRTDCLRFLYYSNWDPQKGLDALTYDGSWKSEWPHYKNMFFLVERVLRSGGLYQHGRDHKYRPLIILRPSELAQFHYQLLLAAAYFLLELVLHNMMIPGQVENWVLLVDLNGFEKVPVKVLKKLIGELTLHYPCRLARGYVLRAGLLAPYITHLLPKNTAQKIAFVSEGAHNPLLDQCAVTQLERKYGGECADLIEFWPPQVPPGPFCSRTDPAGGLLSPRSSLQEYFPIAISSELSPLHTGSFEGSLFSFQDFVLEELDSVSDSYSFIKTEEDLCCEPTKPTRTMLESEEIPLNLGCFCACTVF